MTIIDRHTSRIIFTVLIWTVLSLIVYLARVPLLMLIFGVLFAYLLEPFVAVFQGKLRVSRLLAIVMTYVCLILAISVFLSYVGPKIVAGAKTLNQELPLMTQKVSTGEIARELGDQQGWSYETQWQLQQLLANHRNDLQSVVETFLNRAVAAASGFAWFGLIPVFAAFVLQGKSRFAATLLRWTNAYHDRRFLRAVINDLDHMLASYIRAQLLVAGFSMAAYMVFLNVIGFPFSFLFAGLGGAMEFIPVIGPLASAALILAMALLVGYPHWLAIVAFLLIWRILQDYVNVPLLMKRGVKLPPLAVLLGVIIGGEVAGLPGIYLSIPVMATLRILVKNWTYRSEVIQNENSSAPVEAAQTSAGSAGPYCEFGSQGRVFQSGTPEPTAIDPAGLI